MHRSRCETTSASAVRPKGRDVVQNQLWPANNKYTVPQVSAIHEERSISEIWASYSLLKVLINHLTFFFFAYEWSVTSWAGLYTLLQAQVRWQIILFVFFHCIWYISNLIFLKSANDALAIKNYCSQLGWINHAIYRIIYYMSYPRKPFLNCSRQLQVRLKDEQNITVSMHWSGAENILYTCPIYLFFWHEDTNNTMLLSQTNEINMLWFPI
jgi:hypothetical protein